MQSSIYNFYCLNTLAKHFYRLNPTLSYSNYKLSLTSDIKVRTVSNIQNKLIVFDTDVEYQNKRFIETVMYYQSAKDTTNIKYNIDIFDNLNLDSSLKIVYNFKNEQKMNPYFWSNLSAQNQTELNKIFELLKVIDIKPKDYFTICK